MMQDIQNLERRIAELEAELESLSKINSALMSRVERSTDHAGGAFSLFETNILLQQRVQEHTRDLEKINQKLQDEVSEHKRTENELRISQRRTRQIIDTALDAVIAFDLRWNILDWNPRAAETFGYTTERALNGLTLASLLVPGGHHKLSHYLAGRTHDEMPFGRTIELIARHSSGFEFPVEIAVSILHSAGPPVYSAFIRDITERKQAEETRYKTLFENSPIALREEDFSGIRNYLDKLRARGIEDFRGYFEEFPDALAHSLHLIKVIDVNLATVKLLRAPSKSHVVEHFCELFQGGCANLFIDELVALASGKMTFETESAITTFDAQTIHVAISLSIAPGHANTWSKVFVSMLDISDRLRAEQEKSSLEAQVQQAQKLETIGTLAGGIAHDFNNMLSPILGYADIIADSANDPETIRDAVHNVVTAALRARDLVRQILTFSRQVEHELRPIRPAPLVKEALDLLRSSLPSTVNLTMKIDANTNVIMADSTQIHQVVLNLCTNAYHALEDSPGTISVSLQNITFDQDSERSHVRLAPGEYVCLTVADTGCGIEQSNMERIFEPFFTTKEVGMGTGMGLSVTHGIVQKHGGRIAVESVRGKGTSFSVYLPAVAHAETRLEIPKATISGEGKRVLVIDDEEIVARTTQRLLERAGYNVTVVMNPQDALRMVFHDPSAFDIVLTDQMMPEIPGHIVAKEISMIRSDLPVLLLTGNSYALTEDELRGNGISGVLMKPVSTREITEAVQRILSSVQSG